MRFYKGALATLVISIVVVNIAEVISPLFYKQFFDTVIAASDRSAVGESLFRTILINLAFNGFVWLGYRIASFVENRFLTTVSALLRQQAFDCLILHSYSFFSNNFTGSLVQRVNRLARSFDRLIDKLVWNMIPLFVKIVGVGIVLYLFKPCGGLCLAGRSFFSFLTTGVLWKLSTTSGSLKRIRAQRECLRTPSNHHSIQLFTKTRSESGYFKRVTNEQATAHKTSLDISAVVEAGQALLIILIEFFVFYLAIGYWTENIVTVGFFVLLQAYILGLTHRLWEFSRVVRDIYESYADAKRWRRL